MMNPLRLALALTLLCAASAPAAAQGAFAGKTVTILIPSNPGGGIDAYSRLVSRHIGRHIPGQPNVTVQNVPGAGGLRALSLLVGKPPHDGTVILNVNSGNVIHELMGEPGMDVDLKIPIRRAIQPRAGRLVLFPSYMWHGTVPFRDSQPRTTIAFDVIPKS